MFTRTVDKGELEYCHIHTEKRENVWVREPPPRGHPFPQDL